MAAPAGIITNLGKTAFVGLVGTGATLAAIHNLDRMYGSSWTEHRVHPDGSTNDVRHGNNWGGFAKASDTAFTVVGGLSLMGGAVSSAVESGRMSQSALNAAVVRVLTARHVNPCG